ncbi:MAG: FKBP-type peptidyl-prolyl cis-trans isomerase [Nanoarchaeota archaeon]|nr:FKBP-type peptidyl-prolyl cis-trans isomerase [Nanoarchaeota archaeon]
MSEKQKTKKNDFIELEFVGKVKDGEIFDTNIPEKAKEIGLQIENKHLIICIGQQMVLPGLDKALEDKQTDNLYTIELPPEHAFKDRKKELIRLMPKHAFTEKKIDPRPGMTLALDQTLVKIISVSGGRILVDFNNPLAGKDITYIFTIKRIVTDIKEKVDGILEFFLKGQKIEYEVKDKKIIFKAQDYYKQMVEQLNLRFKDFLEYEMILEEKKEDTETEGKQLKKIEQKEKLN